MRIIAGKHRSRRLESLEGMMTRPMMDRMKESVFQTVGPYFDEDIVLDLFGGSGALALEAISRGAKKAYIVELNRDAIKVIERNVQALKEDDSVIMWQMDYEKALERLQKDGIQFDLVLLDPPYKLNIMESLLESLQDRGLLKDEAQIICQYVRGNFSPFENMYYSIYKNYRYGNSEVCIYQYHLLQS